MKLFLYDLETTGLDCNRHGIHQMAGKIIEDGRILEEFNFYIHPFISDEFDLVALKRAGIDKVTLKAVKYEPPRKVMGDLLSLLQRNFNGEKYFTAGWNNHAFDDGFLRKFFLKNDINLFYTYFHNVGLDIMIISNFFLQDERNKLWSMSLVNVAKYLNLITEEEEKFAHDAKFDSDLTWEVFKKLAT